MTESLFIAAYSYMVSQKYNFAIAEVADKLRRSIKMINKLIKNIEEKDAPIVVGLDPMLSYIPEHIKKAAFDEYGETLAGAGEAIWIYNKGIIDATHDLIPAVKPQIAMYEQFGIDGLIAYKKTCVSALRV